MSFKYVLFFFTLSFLGFSQNQIAVEYNVQIANEDVFKTNAGLRKMLDNSIKDAEKINFTLLCTPKSSFFYVNKKLSMNDYSDGSLIFSGYSGKTYQLNDSIYSNKSLLGSNIYLKKEIKTDWVLTTEEKIIDGYLCYKATSVNKVESKEKVFLHPIVAWYCPTITYNFGPNGYSGLPGLILQLQVRNVTYGVVKIDLNSKESFQLDITKIKTLNQNELDKAFIELDGY